MFARLLSKSCSYHRQILQQTHASAPYACNQRATFTYWYNNAKKRFAMWLRRREQKPKKLVYSGPNEAVIRVTHVLTLCTAGFAAYTMVDAAYDLMTHGFRRYETKGKYSNLVMNNVEKLGYSIGFFSLIGLFHAVSSRYILRIYYSVSAKEFTAVQISLFNPLSAKTFQVPAGGMQVRKEYESFMDVMRGNYMFKGKRYILFENRFRLPLYYNLLFGFNEPEDYELESEDEK